MLKTLKTKTKRKIAFLFNSARFTKEHLFLECSMAFPFCPSYKSSFKKKVSVEQRWSDTDREKRSTG